MNIVDKRLFRHPNQILSLCYSKSFLLILGYLIVVLPIGGRSTSEDNGLSYWEQHWLDQIWSERQLRSYEAQHGSIESSRNPDEVRRQLESLTVTDIEQIYKLQSEYTKLILEKQRKYIEAKPKREQEKIKKLQEEKKQREKELADQRDREYASRAEQEKREAQEEQDRQNKRMIAGFVGVAIFAIIALICKCHFWKRRENAGKAPEEDTTRPSIHLLNTNAYGLPPVSTENLRLNIEMPMPVALPFSPMSDSSRTLAADLQPSAPPEINADSEDADEEDDLPPKYEDVVGKDPPENIRNRNNIKNLQVASS